MMQILWQEVPLRRSNRLQLNHPTRVFWPEERPTQINYIDRDPSELDSIKRTVSLALGITNTVSNLTVEQFAFHKREKVDYLTQFQKDNQYNEWISIGKQVGYLCLTLAVLYGFVRTFKKTPMETIPLGVPLDELGDFAEAGSGNQSGGHRKRSNFSIFEPGPPDERIELMNQLIKDHPQNMTHAIESWLQEDNGKSN
jgi:flagellar biosynthesis/type III secretory pathway M-ring protein FliF/YscJ